MKAHVINRDDGREDGEEWEAEFTGAPYGAEVSVLLVSTEHAGYGPRLHRHPYPETFIIRRGEAQFTVGDEEIIGHAGQIIVVPTLVPHKFTTRGPFESVDIHANDEVINEWLE